MDMMTWWISILTVLFVLESSLLLYFVHWILWRYLDFSIPTVFLKQFRDAANGQRASYQSIIQAPYTVKRIGDVEVGGSIGKSLGEYDISVKNFDSVPIVSELGLQGDPLPDGNGVKQTSPFSFVLDVDFTLGLGEEV